MSGDLDHCLSAIVAGDASAFGRWVAGAEPRVRASLTSVSTSVDVEVVVQETLVRVWQVTPRFVPDGRPNALLRLAIRIARNLAVTELRKQRVRPDRVAAVADAPLSEGTVGPATPDPILRKTIAACREALPKRPAAALTARLSAHAHSDHDLAAGLQMKLNTFLQNVTRARSLLAACLKKHGIDLAAELS